MVDEFALRLGRSELNGPALIEFDAPGNPSFQSLLSVNEPPLSPVRSLLEVF
jgi:hypothetical protein